ncbi:MAG TPA: hypothetical protein VF039_14090 [Longimicrobiales bacterium]
MDHAAYIRGLLSVLVGLSLSTLLQAVHRLLRVAPRVKWSWIPIVWTLISILMVVQSWWAYFTIHQSPIWLNLFAFLLPLSVFVVLFLICASVLPDAKAIPDTGTVDLEALYFAQRRYFFGLWGVLLVQAIVVSWIAAGHVDFGFEELFRVLGIGMGAALALSGRRSVHALGTVAAATFLLGFVALYSARLP